MNEPLWICFLSQKHVYVNGNLIHIKYHKIKGTVQSLIHVYFLSLHSLSFSPTANKNKIREAHRKLMILNHPDRGETSCFVKCKTHKTLQDVSSSELSVLFVFLRQVDPHIWRQKSMRLKIYLTDNWRNKSSSNVWTSPVWCTWILTWSLNMLSSRSDLCCMKTNQFTPQLNVAEFIIQIIQIHYLLNVAKSAWGIFCPHAKFPTTWLKCLDFTHSNSPNNVKSYHTFT